MNIISKQQKSSNRVKNTIKKISKFIASRMFYLLIGLFLAITVSAVYAAWNSTVNSGDTLTSAAWNEHVNKLIDLDNRITAVEAGAGASGWTSEFDDCYTHSVNVWTQWVNCATGYAVTGVWFAGASVTWGQIRCCRLR